MVGWFALLRPLMNQLQKDTAEEERRGLEKGVHPVQERPFDTEQSPSQNKKMVEEDVASCSEEGGEGWLCRQALPLFTMRFHSAGAC